MTGLKSRFVYRFRKRLACGLQGKRQVRSPLPERVFAADVLLIGLPIYLGDTTSQFHAFVERLHFCTLSYDDYSNYFTGKVNVGVICTMNAPQG